MKLRRPPPGAGWLLAAALLATGRPPAAAQETPFHTVVERSSTDGLDGGDLYEWWRPGLVDFELGHGRHGDSDLRAGVRAALDFVKYDEDNAHSNGAELGIVRPIVEGRVGNSYFRGELDVVGVDTPHHLLDFWVAQDFGQGLRVALGEMRVAMGSDYATREENLPLVGHGFTSYLTGRYDWGLRADLGLSDDALGGEAVVTVGNGFGLEGEGKEDPLLLGRAFAQPFRNLGSEWLRGLYFGAAGSLQPGFNDELRMTTPLQSVVFVTRDLDADLAAFGTLEAGWYWGPVRVGCEAVRALLDDVDVGSSDETMGDLRAWSATGSVFLSGDRPQWRRGHWCKPRLDQGGHVELAAGISSFHLDHDLFSSGLATLGTSTQEATTMSLFLNWYPVHGTRVALGAVRTTTSDDLAIFNGTDHDVSVILRFEVDF